MNHYLQIIPTPKRCTYAMGDALTVKKVGIIGECSEVMKSALHMLRTECDCSISPASEADFLIYTDAGQIPKDIFSAQEWSIFDEKFAKEQGYILKGFGDGRVIAAALSQTGAAYAVMTLLQIIGKEVGSFTICDAPDFLHRGIKWTLWAEVGCFSYDFGDGREAMKARLERVVNMMFRYKLNYVHADGFGFDAERYEGYGEIMRHLSEYAQKRGVRISVGGYTMGYGMAAYGNAYQGKVFCNRKSYPDGEIYDCIGTYLSYSDETKGRAYGTCLSNEALFEAKMEEITEFVRKTHVTALAVHNMDAHNIYPGLWLTRCAECRKRWPNDSLFAQDGAAGAFAEFIDRFMDRLRSIKDGDYDASKDLLVSMISPGYMYHQHTNDEEFETGVQFWKSVTDYIRNPKNLAIGFREHYFYHDKDVERAKTVKANIKKVMTAASNFNGCDGAYDDKLFGITSALDYILKGHEKHVHRHGSAFREPLFVFDAEYLWNCDNSGFYNVTPRPTNYKDFAQLYNDMKNGLVRPAEVYGEGGFLEVICKKLYGEKIGVQVAEIYKLHGKNGEPPIAWAGNVELFTSYGIRALSMRWDNELEAQEIADKQERFYQCSIVTQKAYDILKDALKQFDGDSGIRADLECLCECFYMGSMLTGLLSEYMQIYRELHECFAKGKEDFGTLRIRLEQLKNPVKDFVQYVNESKARPLDRFGGIHIRRKEMAEFLDYNTDRMLLSVEQKKRIADGVKEVAECKTW